MRPDSYFLTGKKNSSSFVTLEQDEHVNTRVSHHAPPALKCDICDCLFVPSDGYRACKYTQSQKSDYLILTYLISACGKPSTLPRYVDIAETDIMPGYGHTSANDS